MKLKIFMALLLYVSTFSYAQNSLKSYESIKKEAYTLYDLGHKKQAIEHVMQFVQQNPKSMKGQNLLAVLYYWSGNYKRAKIVLKSILQQGEFPQVRVMLEKIEQKEGVSLPIKSNNNQSVSKFKDTQEHLISLVKKVKSDPLDIKSRKLLALYYEKSGNNTQALYFAQEALKIDPDDSQMLTYLKSKDQKVNIYASKDRKAKALEKLETFYTQKQYAKFMNLYSALEHNNVRLPTEMHVNALQITIDLKKFQKAKTILHTHKMPNSRYMPEIEKLLDEKILLQRFTALED
ncbi:MAG: hypothetical protein K0U47_06935 [Epsilonproteobacteria bacterium]|nr:hypothetical protein [Campylobacterota bacterium]